MRYMVPDKPLKMPRWRQTIISFFAILPHRCDTTGEVRWLEWVTIEREQISGGDMWCWFTIRFIDKPKEIPEI